jgi:hypothetical protein
MGFNSGFKGLRRKVEDKKNNSFKNVNKAEKECNI